MGKFLNGPRARGLGAGPIQTLPIQTLPIQELAHLLTCRGGVGWGGVGGFWGAQTLNFTFLILSLEMDRQTPQKYHPIFPRLRNKSPVELGHACTGQHSAGGGSRP